MKKVNPNLRKAAVLIRSLDADTAATLLGKLSQEETAAVRAEMRSLREVEPEEQADLLAEFRRIQPLASESSRLGVELTLTPQSHATQPTVTHEKRFSFLEHAPVDAVAPLLAREHAQTVAVVLSHLPPPRAAEVLAALPEKLQVETLGRIAVLGETDPECVNVLERELTAWLKKRVASQEQGRRSNMVKAIFAAADSSTRALFLRNLARYSSPLSEKLGSFLQDGSPQLQEKPKLAQRLSHPMQARPRDREPMKKVERSVPKPDHSSQTIHFDDLLHLDDRTLALLLQKADPNVLALALAGSREEFLDRICSQMPRRSARNFLRELRRLTPTRLSDIEAAQRAITAIYASQLADRQNRLSA